VRSSRKKWEYATLEQVCQFQNGFAFKSKMFKDQGTPVLRISSIQNEELCDNRPVFIHRNDYKENLTKYEVYDGDLVIAMSGATTGKIGFNNTGVTFLLNQRVGKFIPSEKLDIKYLFFFLLTEAEKNLKISAGSAQPNLSTKQIKNFLLPLPPLPEQKRIVAILDEAFAGIDQALANTEKNLANAREVFENYLNGVFTHKSKDWNSTTLDKLAEFKNGLNYSKNSKGESIKIVGVKDFQNNYFVPFEGLDTVQIDGKLNVEYTLQDGDILTVRSNGNRELIGRCMLVDGITHKTSYSGFTIRIRLKSSDIDPKFLVHYLKSGIIRKLLTQNGGGANISNLNQKMLSALPIIMPIIERQLQIVKGIEEVSYQSNQLISIYQKKLNALAELKQSILHKAFTGELTQSPEQELAEACCPSPALKDRAIFGCPSGTMLPSRPRGAER
jgi:type I restriction enzyme S subunit